MLQRVGRQKFTDVSEEHTASIFMTKYGRNEFNVCWPYSV